MKLSDVEFSQKGEPTQKQTTSSLAEQGIINDIKTGNEQLAGEKFYIFKLVNNTRKGGVHIPGIDDVMNPNTKRMERIRLLSGVDTIWMKEQKDVSPEYVRQNQRSLSFIRGTKILRIPEYDTTALEFARICSHNIGSPSKRTGSRFEFYEYDPAKEAEEALNREMLELDMAIEAKKQPEASMMKHAAFLGISMMGDYNIPKNPDTIRREYILAAKRNPVLFQKTLASKEVEISWMVRRAISDSKIELNREGGRAYWANNGGMIGSIPKMANPVIYLTELAMTNTEEGIMFKEQLQRIST